MSIFYLLKEISLAGRRGGKLALTCVTPFLLVVSGSTTLNSKEASSQPISAGVTSEVSESDNLSK